MSLEILISSRNNYSLLESFLERNPYNKIKFTNVDDNSTQENISLGKEIAIKNNINFVENQSRGLQWAWKTMIDNVLPDTKFILWMTHDIYPDNAENFDKILEICNSGFLDNFGLIGFNYFGTIGKINIEKNDTFSCGILGRAPLMKLPGRGGWYRSSDVELPWKVYGKPFAIEVPADFGFLINVDLFRRYIIPSNNYHLFNAADDVAYQFLEKNIYNCVLPEIIFHHNQHLKKMGGIPIFSANWLSRFGIGRKFSGNYYSNPPHWEKRWGWQRNNRDSFLHVQDRYEGTLIYDFFHHNYEKGPLKIFKE